MTIMTSVSHYGPRLHPASAEWRVSTTKAIDLEQQQTSDTLLARQWFFDNVIETDAADADVCGTEDIVPWIARFRSTGWAEIFSTC